MRVRVIVNYRIWRAGQNPHAKVATYCLEEIQAGGAGGCGGFSDPGDSSDTIFSEDPAGSSCNEGAGIKSAAADSLGAKSPATHHCHWHHFRHKRPH